MLNSLYLETNPILKAKLKQFGFKKKSDYYNLKMLWNSGQIPSYVHWYNSLMPRLQLFITGVNSKNDDYDAF